MVDCQKKGETHNFNAACIDDCDGDSVYVTAKDYKTENGVVTQMNK